MKVFNEYAILEDIDMVVSQRDNILKLVSLVYHQFKAPTFKSFLQYGWYAGGYSDTHPPPYLTPKELCFPTDVSLHKCDVQPCTKITIILCARCSSYLCWTHFVTSYHMCP